MPDRPTEPARDRAYQRAYERLYDRIDRLEDRLEDGISHFYNVIDELRRRVSMLEKQLKPLAKDGDPPGSPGAKGDRCERELVERHKRC